jgi:hypothetical protein
MLNEYFEVPNYDHQDHENTKAVFISDVVLPPEKYLYQRPEIPPKQYLYLDTQYLSGNEIYFDFIVNIPSSITFDEPKLRAEIEYYKLAGKKYKIEIY